MSDNWIKLVPDDPRVMPDVACQLRAKARFAEIAPKADKVELEVNATIRFFDCGKGGRKKGVWTSRPLFFRPL
jgi:hypothetical protein